MDERFEAGIRLFNDEEFFDAHEIWEELWQGYRGDDRTFLQALIQLAAGFYHAQCLNEKGARSQLSKALRKLEPYRPEHHTVRTETLLAGVHRWVSEHDSAQPDPSGSGGFPRIERTIQPHIS